MKSCFRMVLPLILIFMSDAAFAAKWPSVEELRGISFTCGAGIVDTFSGGDAKYNFSQDEWSVIGQTNDKSVQRSQVVQFFQKSDSPLSELDLKARDQYMKCILNVIDKITSSQSIKRYHPSYGEPTQEEMKEALFAAMEMRGGNRKSPNQIVTENPLNGISLQVVDFEKLGCQVASYGAGYICNYRVTSKLTAFSNETSAAGQNHAAGVNMLLTLINGGQEKISDTATRRFLKTNSGWVSSEE